MAVVKEAVDLSHSILFECHVSSPVPGPEAPTAIHAELETATDTESDTIRAIDTEPQAAPAVTSDLKSHAFCHFETPPTVLSDGRCDSFYRMGVAIAVGRSSEGCSQGDCRPVS